MKIGLGVTIIVTLIALHGFVKAQTITHWQHQAHLRAVVTDQLAREFEEANPGVRIATEHIPFGQYFDKLITALASQTAADVFQVPADMAEQLIGSGFIAPMPVELMTADQARETYLPWLLRFVKGDRIYGIPVDAQTLVLFINDQLYEAAGFTPEDYPTTWDEMAEQAKRLTQRDANGQMVVAGLDTRYNRALLMMAMYGASEDPVIMRDGTVSYGLPENQAGFHWLANMVRGPDRVRDPEFLPGQRPFDLKLAVFYVNHPAARSSIEQAFEGSEYTYTAIPLPKRSAEAPDFTVGSHWAWVVNARSPNQELAWRWILHATSEQAQYVWFRQAGDLPTHLSVACDDDLIQNENDRVIVESLAYARPEMQIGRTEINPIYDRIWERLTLTNDPVESILADAAREHTRINQQAIRDYGPELIEELLRLATSAQAVTCPADNP